MDESINNNKKILNLIDKKIKNKTYELEVRILGDIFNNDTFLIKLKQFDKLNLDYIKFGLLSKDIKNLFDKIKFLEERQFKTKLVCVVFVDISDHFNLVYKKLDLFDSCGIKYIMLDTYNKNNGDLLSFCNISNLDKFISKCKKSIL